jgi:hypothetical protein
MKILVSGDWHGHTSAAKAAAKKANQTGCALIFQVGDFGFWPHTDPDYVRFLALGGGYSIDKQWRLSQGPSGQYWWPQETITQREVYTAIEGGETDVMFTHDAPEGTDIGNPMFTEMLKNTPECHQNRMAVRAVVDVAKPLRLYHGHFHHREDYMLILEDGTEVEVFALADWRGLPFDSTWTVLDTAGIKLQRAVT